ncbi:hypothetical protein SCHPADRAFT_819594 [Schizopora paradoxa]|uniref:Uncharacterized protein n=1 Tax=Schizopora paradoxa TaxID=27342 RepID=A0A0H2S2P2_9AGAM|nr:hypothetical protein SCHPADRAFT_819594 [Schizopora paradoxa]
MASAPPQLVFSTNVRNMDNWARRTGIPLTSADALGTLYARAHSWLLSLKNQLIQNHGWREKEADPRMLFSIECTPPFRSSGGMPRTPPMKLMLPLHASTFFSPERKVQWEMVFHGATFPAMRHTVQPIADILHILQCILSGLLVLVKEEHISNQYERTVRGLPPVDWITANEMRLVHVCGESHYKKLFKAANDARVAFMLEYIPDQQ